MHLPLLNRKDPFAPLKDIVFENAVSHQQMHVIVLTDRRKKGIHREGIYAKIRNAVEAQPIPLSTNISRRQRSPSEIDGVIFLEVFFFHQANPTCAYAHVHLFAANGASYGEMTVIGKRNVKRQFIRNALELLIVVHTVSHDRIQKITGTQQEDGEDGEDDCSLLASNFHCSKLGV